MFCKIKNGGHVTYFKLKYLPYSNVIVPIETAMTSLFSLILRCFSVAVYMTFKFLFLKNIISSKIRFNLSIFNIFTKCIEPP